jgi:hypothetical protein
MTYEIKVTGSGTTEEIVASLKKIIGSLEADGSHRR